jgi:hypothetical protein
MRSKKINFCQQKKASTIHFYVICFDHSVKFRFYDGSQTCYLITELYYSVLCREDVIVQRLL